VAHNAAARSGGGGLNNVDFTEEVIGGEKSESRKGLIFTVFAKEKEREKTLGVGSTLSLL
jgi:hypothetical protein